MLRKTREQHRMTDTPEYQAWSNMRDRVLNPRCPDFPECGGRGITIDPRWLRFSNFLADLGPKPQGTQLWRLDQDGPFSPDNTRWLTPRESAKYRRPRRWFKKPEAQAAA
jgi:hypothetical protein